MESPANISNFDRTGDGPATAPLPNITRGADGKASTGDGDLASHTALSAKEKHTNNHSKE
jgi:hypothetical protein